MGYFFIGLTLLVYCVFEITKLMHRCDQEFMEKKLEQNTRRFDEWH